MNIIKHEIKSNLKAFIIWLSTLGIIVLAASTEYHAFMDNPDLLDLLEDFKMMFDALGIPLVDLSRPEGFLAMMSIYLYMPVAIYAAILGSSMINKEERDKTAEYLFTLPVSRKEVLRGKIITSFGLLISFVVILLTICTLVFMRFDLTSSWYEFMLYLTIALIFTGAIFMSIGMVLSAYMKQYKRSGGITVVVIIVMFMLNILIGLVEELEFLKYVVPFQYFIVDEMLDSNIEFVFVLLSALIITPSIYGVFHFYRKRDLYI